MTTQKATQRPYREIEYEALTRMIDAIQVLREISPAMTLNQALVFLEIARRDGIENLEVRRKTGFKSAMLTTITKSISQGSYQRGNGKELDGLGLVLLTDSGDDGRAKNLNLTEKGKKVAEKIINKIKGLID